MAELTIKNLMEKVEKQRQTFSDDYAPLHKTRIDAIQRLSDLIELSETPKRNTKKKRAKIIATDLWDFSPEVFVLCALAETPSRLGCLKADDYAIKFQRWWKEVQHPEGLDKTIAQLLEDQVLLSLKHKVRNNSPGQ